MKKVFMIAALAFFASGVAFAHDGEKCAKGKSCCSECKKDAKAKAKAKKTAKLRKA